MCALYIYHWYFIFVKIIWLFAYLCPFIVHNWKQSFIHAYSPGRGDISIVNILFSFFTAWLKPLFPLASTCLSLPTHLPTSRVSIPYLVFYMLSSYYSSSEATIIVSLLKLSWIPPIIFLSPNFCIYFVIGLETLSYLLLCLFKS